METAGIRLADYVIVIAFDESQIRHGSSFGYIEQRFPKKDWSDLALSDSLEVFSQPRGWTLSAEDKPAVFFVSTLTDILGSRQYACCLQVYEPCGTVVEDMDDGILEGPSLYKPKVLVVLSRFPFFDLFRISLNKIHLALIGAGGDAEEIVANLVSGVVLAPGCPAVTFTLNNERISVSCPKHPKVPITTDKVTKFFTQLGTIHNVLILISAVLTDNKVLFRSSSLSVLSDSCYALRALLYPFDYPHTYVPILPEKLLECVESPTPYIMGVISSSRIRAADLDSIVVDLDIGAVSIPSTASIPYIPAPFAQRLISSLQMVLYPGLATADNAYKLGNPPLPNPELQDKRLRACFVLFFGEMLAGYRSCLEVVRLHKPPLIVFHKSAFLGLRNLSSCALIRTFFGSLIFQSFIFERGLPYRVCDLFDEFLQLVVNCGEHGNGKFSKMSLMEIINEIAEKLMENERQDHPISFSSLLTHKQFMVPSCAKKLNGISTPLVTRLIEANLQKQEGFQKSALVPKKVPSTSVLSLREERLGSVVRRVQVLNTCLRCIFDSKLSDARKMLCAVELSMRSVNVRVSLCQLLWSNLNPINRATLLPQQFELLVRLSNCALSQESKEDEHGIAYAMLYLSNMYCRRLTPGVHQFMYTCIQDHPVWDNCNFWDAAFFHDVHRQLRRLYMPNVTDTWNLWEKPSGLELASDRLANLPNLPEQELNKCIYEESSIVYGQAKHYINLMVYMKVPLDASKLRRVNLRELERRGDKLNRKVDSEDDVETADSESDVESGFLEADSNDLGNGTVKWVDRLIDRICSAAGLEQSQIEKLCNEIPGFVALHIDNLEQVYTESKRLSPLHKPKLLEPVLLFPAERIVMGGLRVFLINDGRSTNTTVGEYNGSLLPAEGAIFLTNYRIIFKGQPCDPFLCEQVVIRTIPIMSITKEKQIGDQSVHNSNQLSGISPRVAHQLHDAVQIRSACFQLMKIAFDEEVTAEKADEFLQTLNCLRWPTILPQTIFAYSESSALLSNTLEATSSKHKFGTIRHLEFLELKKSLIRNPLRDKKRIRGSQKAITNGNDVLPSPASTSPAFSNSANRSSMCDYLDITDYTFQNFEFLQPLCYSELSEVTEAKVDNAHYHYVLDYDRLGLNHSPFRLSAANRKYELAKGYPNLLVVPASISDERFTKISKGFKHGRFPVVTWKSSDNALLIRGSGLASQTVVSRFKKQTNIRASDQQSQGFFGSHLSLNSRESGNTPHSSELQELYISTLATLSPRSNQLADGCSLLSESMESLLSFDSIITSDGISIASNTPDAYRRSPTAELALHATSLIRSSGGKGGSRSMANGRYFPYSDRSMPAIRLNAASTSFPRSLFTLNCCVLYIFGDRNYAKGLKLDKSCEFIPVTYPSAHNVKIAFKKFLRALCPSWDMSDDQSTSLLKQVDESSWPQMVASLLYTSCAVVDMVDVQRSSVALCLEDGWDATCQISALSQLLLDPFYRTIDGFRVLVEKEWLAFGHRFSHRANHSEASQSSGIAPMFLMFLDAVHQVLEQLPSAFEFNDFYLRFLAYHSMSACFQTFLLDSEAERVKCDSLCVTNEISFPTSVWTYIEKKKEKSTVFNNFRYSPDSHSVLRPQNSIASISLWSFYSEDYLAHGAPYDIEIAEMESQQREDEHFETMTELSSSGLVPRRILDINYHSIDISPLDAFSTLLEKQMRLHSLLSNIDGKPRETWKDILPSIEEQADLTAFSEDDSDGGVVGGWRQHVQRAVQRKETLKLILKGLAHQGSASRLKEAVSDAQSGHRFVSHPVSSGDTCAVCHHSVPGVVIHSIHMCSGCGMICHETCSAHVTSSCANNLKDRKKAVVPRVEYPAIAPKPVLSSSPETKTLTLSASRPNANAAHSGYLMKRGATFKLWKPRWFVLDCNRHQLRYYENETDMNCRGVIELSDVKSVELSSSHALKKPLLEIRTSKRVFALLADSKVDAEVWLEKILTALKD